MANSYVRCIDYSIYKLDENLKIIEVDENFEIITGYSKEDIKKNSIYQGDLIPEEDREEYYKLLATIDRDNKILSTKTEMSDIDFVKWNRSIFGYAKKSSHLVLKKGFKVTSDVTRVVRNIVHPSSIRSSKVYSN